MTNLIVAFRNFATVPKNGQHLTTPLSLDTTTKDKLTGNEAGGKIEKNEMGGACGAYGGGERCAQGSGGET